MLEMKDGKTAHHQVNNCASCYVGKWGDIPVLVVQTAMGAKYQAASYETTTEILIAMPKIKYVFGVGVCGGVQEKVELGDVVVSSKIVGYDNSKVLPEGEQNRDITMSTDLGDFYRFIKQSQCSQDRFDVCFGPVLSGSKVIADANKQAELRKNFCSEAVAFEMEGSGICAACISKAECLIIKGVCDHADKDKNDDWQPDAARMLLSI